jgi:hypothetical protein
MSVKAQGRSGRGRALCTPGPTYFSSSVAYFAGAAFAFASLQSSFDMDVQPVPLQLCMPLQLCFADMHSDMPLHEFTPAQWTAAASAATDTVANPDVNNIAAAAAIVALDSLLICIIVPQMFLNAAILLLTT